MQIEKFGKTLTLLQGDITKQTIDAIVNAANSQLAHGGGVAAAIARAGGKELQIESSKHPHVPTGEVGVTTAGNLKAEIVIHAVGPIWNGGNSGEAELLASAIKNSLLTADSKDLKSIAFPAISTGIYGYPLEDAANVILSSIIAQMEDLKSLTDIRMVLFSDRDIEVFKDVLKTLKAI